MVLVSLLGLLTTLWLGQTLNTNAFNQAVYEQRSSGFLKLVTDHYARTGSWDGLENIIPRQGAPLPAENQHPRDAAMPPCGDTPLSLKLEQVDKQRKQLTADIAHDLGTPLTVVSEYVQSMQSGKLKATPERLEIMQDELKLLRNLIEDLRLLSLADAGQLRLSRNKLQPTQLLEASRNAFTNDANSKEIALKLEYPAHLPEIDADFERMRLVLGNIISNALRHTPNGGSVTISASYLERQLLFEVNDTGSGIAQEQLPYIFERFYRADQHRSAEYGGTGLGLAIAKSIVELHGGAIRASSWLGRGTSVQIALLTA